MKSNAITDVESAIQIFTTVIDYKDSAEKIELGRQRMKDLNEAEERYIRNSHIALGVIGVIVLILTGIRLFLVG